MNLAYLGAGLGIGLAALGAAIGVGFLVGKGLEAIGRQPEVAPVVRVNMIIGIAFAEALALYALVVSFLLIGK